MRSRVLVVSVLAAGVLALLVFLQCTQAPSTQGPPEGEVHAEIAPVAKPAPTPTERAHALVVSVNEAGAPVPGARIVASLRSESSSPVTPAWANRIERSTDAEGQARLHVSAGQWFVIVRKRGFADSFQDVIIGVDDETTSVTVSLERGFDVSGVSVDTSGHTLAPAEIKAIPLGDQLTKRKTAPEGEQRVSVEANGAFTLRGLSRGWWRLEGTSEGFGRSEARIISVPTAEFVRLVFRRSGFIEGFVVNGDGSPAAQATVSVVGEGGMVSVDASETGAFALERDPGAYRLSARRADLVGSLSAPTFVRARSTTSVYITLEGKGATLRGQVTRDDGAPVAGATILVSPNLEDAVLAETQADADGRWMLTGLAPGTVDVEASLGGMSPTLESGFHLVDGADVEVDLTLTRLGALEGTVVGPDGRGVAAARVTLRGKFEQFPERQALTDTSGAFTFGDVPDGEVVVRAALDTEDSGTTVTTSVAAGVTTRVSIALPARGELRVQLDRAACKHIEDVTLRAFEPDASHPAVATVAPSATQHVLLKLRAGTWSLRAVSRSWECSGQTGITLDAGARPRSASIRLTPAAATLQVTVLESTQDPAPGAQVTVVTKEGALLRAETDLDGRALLAIGQPMVASINALKRGRSARVTGAAINGARVSLTLAPAARLRVHIVGHQSMTRVTAVDRDGESMPIEARTAEANVLLSEVPAGTLDVRASNADDSRFGASAVTTHPGETAEVSLTLKGVGFLAGGATLPPSAQGQARVAVSSALGTMVEPLDTKGRFKLGPMPEDQYTVELRCMGCTWEARSIHVGAGEEAHVEFE